MAPTITRADGARHSSWSSWRVGVCQRVAEDRARRLRGVGRVGWLGIAVAFMMAAVVIVATSGPASAATTGVTVAGGNGQGSAANQLYQPEGVVVDRAGNLYVADTNNSRVQRWRPGATSGVTVAGGYSRGCGYLQIGIPVSLALDNSGNLYVADWFCNQVQKFSLGSPLGVTVAGGNGPGSGPSTLTNPQGVAVDSANNVYVADSGNNRVQRWAPGATSGVTVAGGHGAGPAANQLFGADGVKVDASGNVYVTDTENNRVQRWAPGATSGVTVAGGHGAGPAANQLDRPFGVALDAFGNLYVSDTGNNGTGNNRVQLWAPGATSGVTVAGGNGAGSAANQLTNPVEVALDRSANIYVADAGNDRVQRWPAVLPTVLPGTGIVTAPSIGTTDLAVPVTLSLPSTLAVTVHWATLFVPGAPPDPWLGPQAPITDYIPSSGTVTFAPGDTAATVHIPVLADSSQGPDEHLVISFSAPTNVFIGGFWGLGFGVITPA